MQLVLRPSLARKYVPICSAGSDGILYSWDLRTRRCLAQMVDCGNKDSAALAVSKDSRYLATGSASGVVNVYRKDQCWGGATGPAALRRAGLPRPTTPTPVKEVMNITTTVDTLAFSPDAQILVRRLYSALQHFCFSSE